MLESIILIGIILLPIVIALGLIDMINWYKLGTAWENCELTQTLWRVTNSHIEGLTPQLVRNINLSELNIHFYIELFDSQYAIEKIMENTIIHLKENVYYTENNVELKIAKGKARTLTLFCRYKQPFYVIELSLTKMSNMTSLEIASLIAHELTHHYLADTTGNYWGGEEFEGEHTHPLWKRIGV